MPFCRLYFKFCDSYQPDICFIRCMCGYCRLDQCHYLKKSEKRSNSHLWFSYPWKFKKVIFFKNIKFWNSIFLADINYTFCLIMTPIIPSLSPLFDFLLPRNISGTDLGTGYGGTVCGFHTRPKIWARPSSKQPPSKRLKDRDFKMSAPLLQNWRI